MVSKICQGCDCPLTDSDLCSSCQEEFDHGYEEYVDEMALRAEIQERYEQE
jgi:hypothetical protein